MRSRPGFLQQRKVLHIARANLDHVGPLGHLLQRLGIQRLGNNAQPESFPDFGHDAQRFNTQSLKCIRRSPRLVRAAAEELRSRRSNLLGNGERLFAALNRARTGNHGQLSAADSRIRSRETDNRVLFLHIAAG